MSEENVRIPLTKGNGELELRSKFAMKGKIKLQDKEMDDLKQLRDEVDNAVAKLHAVSGIETFVEAFNVWTTVLQKLKVSKELIWNPNSCYQVSTVKAERVTEEVGCGQETIYKLIGSVDEIRKDIEGAIGRRFENKKREAVKKALQDPSVADALTKALEAAGVIFE